ncbi:MAG: hypothetical protein HQL21_07110 [Candidatus Omnitrophica bacterium]|nr:hypothetical protein [Candidatus Omnitrophota bacterium]
MKKILFMITCVTVLSLCLVRPLGAEEKPFEETATGKAAKALITSYTNFVKDITAMNKMTTQQKMEYILAQGKERIWEETASRAKDAVKDKMVSYIEARARADLFKAAVPSMMHQAIVEGKAVSAVWSAADIDIKSKLDTTMNGVKAGIASAEIAWTVYSTWSTKGAEEGCRELGKQVGDKVMEYFIPGWGYYRLAQAAVEALGNYVVGYAFDTSLEAKLNVILDGRHPKSNPKAFTDWIMATDIPSYVQKEWDEQLAYSGWYLKGKENEGDNMKGAIITALQQMKSEIQKRREIEQQVRAKLEALDSVAKSASSGVQGAIDTAGKDASPVLSAIESFKTKVYEYKKEDYKEVVDEAQDRAEHFDSLYARASPVFKYESCAIDRQAVLNALREAFDSFTDSGVDGYDQNVVEVGIERYQEVRKKALADSWNKIQDLMKEGQRVSDEAGARFRPQADAVWAKARNNMSPAEREALYAEYNRVIEAWSAVTFPYANIGFVFGTAYSQDVEILSREEQMVMLEVKDRVMSMRAAIDKLTEEMQNEIAKMDAVYAQDMAEFQSVSGGLVDRFDEVGRWQEHKDQLFMFTNIGNPIALMDSIKQIREDLQKNKELYPQLLALSNKAYNNYESSTQELIKKFQNTVPKSLQVIEKKPGYRYEFMMKDVISPLVLKVVGNVEGDGILSRAQGRAIAYIPVISEDAENHAMILGLKDRLPWLEKSIRFFDGLITEMDFYDSVDRMALTLNRLMTGISDSPILSSTIQRTMPQEAQLVLEVFRGGAGSMSVASEKSKGVEHLAQLKEAWAQSSDLVAQMEKLFSGINKSIKYHGGFNDEAKTMIDGLKTIPARIALYEERYAIVQKEFDASIVRASKNLDDAKKRLKYIEKHGWYKEKLENLEEFKVQTLRSALSVYATWVKMEKTEKVIADWTELEQEVDLAIEKAKKDIEAQEKEWALKKSEEDSRRQQEEANTRKSAEEQRLRQERNFTPQMYQVLNTRINSRAIPVLFGDLILLPDDLKQGAIEITARLNSIDKLDRILFSEDGGRTWAELPVRADIMSTITMIPDKTYNPVLKIRSTLADELTIPLFPNLNIIYRDLNVQQMVAQSVKQLAESYERKDPSAFSQLISRSYLGNKNFLEEGVRLDFDMFTDIRLMLYINRIEKRGKTYIAETKWDKDQTPRKTGLQQKTSGNTTMIFVLEDGQMKIQNLRGNLIYATMSPQIAQASGLSASVVDQIRTAAEERNPTQPGAGTILDAGGVAATTNSVTLTSPVGGESWNVAASRNITWTSSGSASNVKIEYSTNGGASYPNTITDSTSASSGSYTWAVPDDPSSTVRVRISDASDASVYDVSDGNFTIASGASGITVTAPSAGNTVSGLYFITWTVSGVGPYVEIKLSSDGGATFPDTLIANSTTGTPGPGFPLSYGWMVPAGAQCNLVLRLTSVVDPTVTVDSGEFCKN